MIKQDIECIQTILASAQSILIPIPELDSYKEIASAIALGVFLQSIDKKVTIVCTDAQLVEGMSFLDTSLITSVIDQSLESVLSIDISEYPVDSLKYTYNESKLHIYISSLQKKLKPEYIHLDKPQYQYDLVITLNMYDWAQLGGLFTEYPHIWLELPSLALATHPIAHPYSENTIIDTQVKNTAQMIMQYIEHTHKELLSLPIAKALMTSLIISQDTSIDTHKSIIHLQEWGVDYDELNQTIHNLLTPHQLQLLGYILVHLQWNEVVINGISKKYASSKLFLHNFEKTKTTENDISIIMRVLPRYISIDCIGIHLLLEKGQLSKDGYMVFPEYYQEMSKISSQLQGIYSQGMMIYSYPSENDIHTIAAEIHTIIAKHLQK
jgi:nanoRNase/pAp phosphatase (c-di-AMP/oligoRNAs hydrolase)